MQHSLLPLAGIYWSDELPETGFSAFHGEDFETVVIVLGIRKFLWRDEPLSELQQAHWSAAQRDFPDWPIFCRLQLSPPQLQEQLDTERDSDELWAALTEGAEQCEGEVSHDGLQRFSASFDLNKFRKPKRWWQFWR